MRPCVAMFWPTCGHFLNNLFIFGFLKYRLCILHLGGALFLYIIGSLVILLNIFHEIASIYCLQVTNLRRSGLRRMSFEV